jgi:hypothetical protein
VLEGTVSLYFYDRIGPTQAVIISAGADRLLDTLGDIFMPIRLATR